MGIHPVMSVLAAVLNAWSIACVICIWVNTATAGGLVGSKWLPSNQIVWIILLGLAELVILLICVAKMLFWVSALWAFAVNVFVLVALDRCVRVLMPHTRMPLCEYIRQSFGQAVSSIFSSSGVEVASQAEEQRVPIGESRDGSEEMPQPKDQQGLLKDVQNLESVRCHRNKD
jgi:hypothetical protein